MDTRNMPLEGPLLRMQDGLKKFGERPLADQFAFACNQAHIALGTALVAAAAEDVDSTPMGGFNPAAVDEILGLPELNLGASVLLTLGYRSPDDFLAKAKKVRRASSDFFIFNPPVKG